MDNAIIPVEKKPRLKKFKHPDRLSVSPEALTRLGQWMNQISDLVKGVKVTRSDILNLIILNHREALPVDFMEQVEEKYFDEVKFAQWSVGELKTAKERGETLTLSDLIKRHKLQRIQKIATHSSGSSRKKKSLNSEKVDTHQSHDRSDNAPIYLENSLGK